MPAPTYAQELLVAKMRENWAGDMVRIQATLATVLRSGGTAQVYIRPDGPNTTAELLVPFIGGMRPQPGKRVVVQPIQGGVPVVIGVVPTDTSDLATIGTENIIPGSITAALLAPGAITYSALDSETRGRIDVANTTASEALNRANSAASTASSAYTNANTALNNASAAQNTANTALSTANSAASEAARAHTRIGNLDLTPDIPALSITSGKLAADSVTSPKILNGAVGLTKLEESIRQTLNKVGKICTNDPNLCRG